MTDVVDAGAATAAPEVSTVPIEPVASAPSPVESGGPERAPEPVVEQKPSATPREALDKAFAKVEAKGKEAEAKPVEAKVEPKPRDETGKFASKTAAESQAAPPVEQKAAPVTETQPKPTAFHEAPKRFSDEAKSSWEGAPEPVRAEIHRAVKELETGLSQYKEVVEPLKPYLQLAQQNGTTINKALDQYMGLERALKSSDVNQKLSGIEEVFRHAGISPRDYAAHILNQSPDQVTSQQDATVRRLEQHIANLEQKLGGVTQTIEQQREQATLTEVQKFASEHPRFEELSGAITEELRHGYSLSEAYDRAERLNPAPLAQLASKQEPVIPAQPEAQPKGSKSISGAPSQGSNPAAKRVPAKSNREALDRAFAAMR